MAEATLPLQSGAEEAPVKRKASSSALVRLTNYTLVKLATLLVTVVLSVYLTILIANMGGYVDEIRRGQIQEAINQQILNNPQLRTLSQAERTKYIEEQVRIQEERIGLNRPFIVRSFSYLTHALTLNLGRAEQISSDSGSRQVRLVILERLAPTLLLFAAANLITFFLSVFSALYLSRKYGSLVDKLVVMLSPTSAAPGWFYGLFLILIFAAELGILPFDGMVDAPPPPTLIPYALSLLKHMVLPVAAWTISTIFGAIFAWRTFFLIYSSEDYVEMAKAKGLSSREIERRYILHPTMPNIITTFALTLITLWQGAPILETVFNWPGLGRLILRAIGLYDTPVIVGVTVIFAYLLAITVFLLDFIYALVDPRVKVGGGGQKA